LKPFDIVEVAEFLNLPFLEGFLVYSLLGGTPSILENFQMSPYSTLKEAIAYNLFSEESRFLEDPIFFLNEEVSKLGKYWDVLRIVSSSDLQKGRKHKQILKALGLSEGYSLSEYLNLLKRLELLVNDRHIGEKEARWKTAEPFLITWFNFIEPERTFVGLQNPEEMIETHFRRIQKNTGKMYEFFWRKLLRETFRTKFREIGTLFRPSGDKKKIFEFDIAFTSKRGISAIFECKFLLRNLDKRAIVSELKKLSAKVPCEELAENAVLALVCPRGIFTLDADNSLVEISPHGFPIREALGDVYKTLQNRFFKRPNVQNEEETYFEAIFEKAIK